MNQLSVARFVEWLYGRLILPRIKRDLGHLLVSTPTFYGPVDRLEIAEDVVPNNTLFNLSSGRIVVRSHVIFGHNVSLLTGSHDYRLEGSERKSSPSEGRDIVVGEAAWLGSNCTILGPCEIGHHAVVAAGAVVTRNVEPWTVVGGVPAKTIKHIRYSHET